MLDDASMPHVDCGVLVEYIFRNYLLWVLKYFINLGVFMNLSFNYRTT